MPTIPRQFRLADDTLAHLDRIAAHLGAEHARTASRADAIRAAAWDYVRRLDRAKKGGKKIQKKLP